LIRGEYNVEIVTNEVDCPNKVKYGDIWKCQVYVDKPMASDPFSFSMWKFGRPEDDNP